ncbi:tol-pal system YbgF family protein [Bacillus sp. V59.32b]|uniref:tetratricopeptide repeat protein n=1 Tax=Bacillus sp. V59.32b TaxID=1758642 RepID=UPI001058E391|nr:hypothetical protein [Bacillus sp. V59.32b]
MKALDDNQLVEKLDSLKEAYSEIPLQSNPDKIASGVKKNVKKPRRRLTPFSYVACILGVGMISGILLMQWLGDLRQGDHENPSFTENTEPFSETKENEKRYTILSVDELREYYQNRVRNTSNIIGMNDFQNTKYAMEVNLRVHETDRRIGDKQITEDELPRALEEVRMEIESKLITPSEIKEEMNSAEGKEYNRLLNVYLAQQQTFLKIFQDKHLSRIHEIANLGNVSMTEETLERLNANQPTGDKDLDEIGQRVVEQGFKFIFEGEGLAITIDYQGLSESEKGKLNAAAESYLSLKEKYPKSELGFDGSREELGQVLVKYEEAIKSNEKALKDDLIADYHFYYEAFIRGKDNYPLTVVAGMLSNGDRAAWKSVSTSYPDTETAAKVEEEYEKLEKDGFRLPKGYTNEKVSFPSFAEE